MMIPHSETIEIQDGILLLQEMTEPVDRLINRVPEALTDQQFKKITSNKRQQEWLAIRALLQSAGCKADQLLYSEEGQPRIIHPEYSQISISHSDKLAGVLLHRYRKVGLDIENRNRNFIRVEKKYLSPEERSLAATIPDGYGLFWCIKEAVYKAAGIPGIFFAEQIRICSGQNNMLTAKLIADDVSAFELNFMKTGDQLIVYAIAETAHGR